MLTGPSLVPGKREHRPGQCADDLLGTESADVVLLEDLAYSTERERSRLRRVLYTFQ
jgi:hypothetical protein